MVVFCKPLKSVLILLQKKGSDCRRTSDSIETASFSAIFFVNFRKPCTLNHWDLRTLDIYNTKNYVHTGVHQCTPS